MTEQQHISRRERQILDILYQQGEASAREVLERLPDPPSYSAVRALLSRLVDKGLARFHQQGRHYLYAPGQPRSEARQFALHRLVKTFFQGSPAKAANALLGMNERSIDPDELEALRRQIDAMEQRSRQE